MRKPAARTAVVIAGAIAATAVAGSAVAAAARPSGGHESFSVLSTKQSATPTVVATGPVHALGTVVPVNASTVKFVFPNGSVTVQQKHQGRTATAYDATTCLHKSTSHGLWKVTKATQRYRGSLGVGLYTSNVRWVQCGKHGAVKLFISDTEGSGRIGN